MFNGKSVLITGGTGSFGKAFVQRLIQSYSPKKVVIYSRDELKQYEMAKVYSPDRYPCLRYFLGDVRDSVRLNRALRGIDYVVHAAALKHVSAAEYNPFEFIKTNILGSENLIDGCIERGVKRVIALSTDKAASPINLYGASKLCAEKLFVSGNSMAGNLGTLFGIVRYGNVVGSRGSVIPLFLNKKNDGVIPVTDMRMTRFWITLEKAIDLVIHAFSETQGGEIFVPKIPSMRIADLAEALAPECKVEVIGIKPGEKLHECMIGVDDSPFTLEYDNHYTILPAIHNWHRDRPKNGRPVPTGFSYTSENNAQWLTKNQLLEDLEHYELVGAELTRKSALRSVKSKAQEVVEENF